MKIIVFLLYVLKEVLSISHMFRNNVTMSFNGVETRTVEQRCFPPSNDN